MRFIYINAAVYLLLTVIMIVLALFKTESSLALYLELPSNLWLLIRRPWTLLTYMFVHLDFLHILFNMLWLYWFGKIFMQFFTGRQFGGLYLLGGLAGAVLFLLSYNTLPLLRDRADFSFLAGASASVMAIVFAVAFYQKDFIINLLFIGRVKLIWLAVGVLALDVLALSSSNVGGHIAHIGGALLGICFASQYRRGKDITATVNRWLDGIVNCFSAKPTFRVKRPPSGFGGSSGSGAFSGGYGDGRRAETDAEYLLRKKKEEQIIDEILDKLKRSGYESLSAEEKRRLFEASKK